MYCECKVFRKPGTPEPAPAPPKPAPAPVQEEFNYDVPWPFGPSQDRDP
jgi:hypothetical protein